MKVLIEIDAHNKNVIDRFADGEGCDILPENIFTDLIESVKNGIPVPDNVSPLSVTEFADKCRKCGAKNFIRIPNNATNGDVIKVMFPQYTPRQCGFSIWLVDDTKGIEHAMDTARFDVDFWNAPYKGGE